MWGQWGQALLSGRKEAAAYGGDQSGYRPGHCFLEKEDTGDFYYGRNRYDYNYLAVTAACLLVRNRSMSRWAVLTKILVVGYNAWTSAFPFVKTDTIMSPARGQGCIIMSP